MGRTMAWGARRNFSALQITCGSGFTRDCDVECTDVIAGKPAPTRFAVNLISRSGVGS